MFGRRARSAAMVGSACRRRHRSSLRWRS